MMVVPTIPRNNEAEADVLIVGAGPSGLVAALTLSRMGIPVRVIEKNLKHRMGQRGAGITPRTLEAFDLISRTVRDKILDESIDFPMLKSYALHGGIEGGKIFEMSPNALPSSEVPWPNLVCIGQNNLEKILRDELDATYGVKIELATELVSFSQVYPSSASSGSITPTQRTFNSSSPPAPIPTSVSVRILNPSGAITSHSYAYLIGADGARGRVRKDLKLTFLGETSNTDNICLGDILVYGLDTHFWHMWGDAQTNMISLRPTETPPLFNFIISGKDVEREKFIAEDGLIQKFLTENVFGAGSDGKKEGVVFGSVTWKSTYRPNIRMVNKMGEGRVLLVGDSAHVHSFTGAQGINTGIQDSFHLAWKLGHTHLGLAPPGLLATYGEERLPVIAQMLLYTTRLMHKTKTKEGSNNAWRRDVSLLQLGINCRWSSIVVDQGREDGRVRDPVEVVRIPERFGLLKESEVDIDRELDPNAEGRLKMGKGNPIDPYGQEGGDSAGALRAGDRAPGVEGLKVVQAPSSLIPLSNPVKEGTTIRLFDILSITAHTILMFSPSTERLQESLDVVSMYPPGVVQTVLMIKEGESESYLDRDSYSPTERLRRLSINGDPGIFGRPASSRRQAQVDAVLEDLEENSFATYAYDLEGGCDMVVVRPDGILGGVIRDKEGLAGYLDLVLKRLG